MVIFSYLKLYDNILDNFERNEIEKNVRCWRILI